MSQFPSTPTVGQIYTSNGFSWQWDGVAWGAYGSIQNALQRYNLTLNTNLQETLIDLSATDIQIDSFTKLQYSTAEYTLQFKQGSAYRSSKFNIVNDGTNISFTEYAILQVGTEIPIVVSASIVGSNVVIYANITNAASSNVTAKAYRLAVTA